MSPGRLAAGIAHEVNNPASAAARSAVRIEDTLAQLAQASAVLERAGLDTGQQQCLNALRAQSADSGVEALSPLERTDREDRVAQCLAGYGSTRPSRRRSVDDGGHVSVIARRSDHDTITVAVVDDGPGIPEDVRSRIFDPFFTTKRTGDGTGLGLDVARRVVRRHNGVIELVESRPGHTEFCVRLPAV